MTRDEKLKAIQQSHDEWVEVAEIPEVDGTAYPDANQFGLDIEGDQMEFLAKIDKKIPDEEVEEEPDDQLEKAVQGLEALLEVLKAKA